MVKGGNVVDYDVEVGKLSFEEALEMLQETVNRMDSGDLPLEEMLALFQLGTRLAEHCNELLDKAELKVKELSVREDGEVVEKTFEGPMDARSAQGRRDEDELFS